MMLWLLLAIVLLPVVAMILMSIGRRRRPGYSGNGDLYGELPGTGAEAEIGDVRSLADLQTNAQIRAFGATGASAQGREHNGF